MTDLPTAETPVAPTLGLRHAVLWVSDPGRSADFYREALGLEVTNQLGSAVFMSSPASATDHDLALFKSDEAAPESAHAIGLYHLAWEVATIEQLMAAKDRLVSVGAYVGENNHGMSRSIYAQDPDGIEFEIMWEVPVDLLLDDEPANQPLDFGADIARFGSNAAGRGAR